MKKIILMCLLTGISVIIFAQETGSVSRFSLGGGMFLSNGFIEGGSADFAFLLLNKNYFDIRNHIVFRGGSLADNSLILISEKISFGGMAVNDWRAYCYIEGGIGFTSDESKNYFEKPLTYSIGGGGGTDLFYFNKSCIYFEAGVLYLIKNRDWSNGSIFQIGWKTWF